jgi:hypothetical protein
MPPNYSRFLRVLRPAKRLLYTDDLRVDPCVVQVAMFEYILRFNLGRTTAVGQLQPLRPSSPRPVTTGEIIVDKNVERGFFDADLARLRQAVFDQLVGNATNRMRPLNLALPYNLAVLKLMKACVLVRITAKAGHTEAFNVYFVIDVCACT